MTDERLTEQIEAQKEILASAFDKAQAYTNVIIFAGFAGYFGIWSLVKDKLTDATVFSSALLISLSIAAFVAWEVYGMIHRSRALMGIAKAVDEPSRYQELIMQHRKDQQVRSIALGKLWHVVLVFTLVTGFSAMAILLSALIHGLWSAFLGT